MEINPSIFGFQWHDSLMPVGPNYTALERAAFECACAGCESIWITVNDDWAPLIKKRLGSYIYDPVYYTRMHDPEPSSSKKYIPIFYVPHLAKYRGRRDNMSWGIMNAAIYARKVTKVLSHLVFPDRYYAAFPYSITNPRELVKVRKKISSSKPFFTTYNGKTVKDGERLGFTFDWEDLRAVNRLMVSDGTLEHKALGDFVKDSNDWKQRRVIEEQYSARFFPIEKVFEPMSLDGAIYHDWKWHHDISSWEGYKNFMGSDDEVIRPQPLDKADILHPIGVDDE
jgi:hypothetical protein